MLTEESGPKLCPPDTPLEHQIPLPVTGSADRDPPGRRRDLERVTASRATVDGAKASHGAGKKRTPERPRPRSHAGAWERSKKEGSRRAPHRAGRRPGRCRPGVRRGVQRGQGWGVGGRHRSRADRWGAERTGTVVSGAPISSGKPEKNPEFFHFFCDSGILRDCSAGRSTVAAERPGAVASPQPSERTGNILKGWPARPGRVSGFRENGKPEPGPIAGQGGRCGGRRGAAGWGAYKWNTLKRNAF